jgi:hypothetical protein
MGSSVYYYHLVAQKGRVDRYEEVKEAIDYLFIDKHKKEWAINIFMELLKMGYHSGKNKVIEFMRDNGYLMVRKPKWHRYSSYEGDLGGLKVNEMKQDFTNVHPYEKASPDVSLFSLSLRNPHSIINNLLFTVNATSKIACCIYFAY